MKKFLVTGGNGFIGSGITNRLINSGHNITIYDNNSRNSIKKNLIHSKVNFIDGDIRDKEKLLTAFNDVDAVIHLAFINGTKFFYEKPELVLDVGIKGMINVAECIKEKKISELYLASSSEVYQTPNKIPTDENEKMNIPDAYNPRYSYGAGKIISEIIAINYCRNILDKLIIFRPHNVYGPNMGTEHIIPSIINKIIEATKKNNDKIIIEGDGKQTRAFNYIDDFCDGFLLLINKANGFNTYNIGSSKEIKIIDIAQLIMNKLEKNLKIETSQEMPGGTKRRCPNISKIEKLGYKEKINIDIGLNKTIDWYKNIK